MTIRNIISEAFRRGKANKPDPFYQKMSDDAYEGAVKMHITMNSGPEYKGVTFTDKNRVTMRKHRDAGAHPSKAFSAMMNEEILDEGGFLTVGHKVNVTNPKASPRYTITAIGKGRKGKVSLSRDGEHHGDFPKERITRVNRKAHELRKAKDIHELSKATLRRYTDDAVWDGADHLHKARMKDRVADREDVNPMTRSIAKQEKAKHQKKVKNRVDGVQKAKEKLDESKKTSERINHVYVTSKGPDGEERKDLHRNRGHSFRQAKKTALKSVQRMLPNHKIMKAFKKKDNEPIFEEHETVNEATLGGPKYIGTENPNNRKSRMPGVFSPFKRAANQARAEVAFNKHAVAATKAFVQRNMATLAKTTSAYAKRTKRHEQAMTAAEKCAPRDITKRGELMYESEDIHEISKDLAARYVGDTSHDIVWQAMRATKHSMEKDAAKVGKPSKEKELDAKYHDNEMKFHSRKVNNRQAGIDRALRRLKKD